jgi:hypothetical protein
MTHPVVEIAPTPFGVRHVVEGPLPSPDGRAPAVRVVWFVRTGRDVPELVTAYTYEEILARDKVSLDLFWLGDESLEDSANLPEPHLLAQEIADDLRAALAQIEDVFGDLEQRAGAGASDEA